MNDLSFGLSVGVWIAAQVKIKREFSVSALLGCKGYETFVPAYLRTRQWSDRQKTCQLPLFSGYVFVQASLGAAPSLVVSTPGVLKLVGFGGKVAPIDEREIERVRTVANSPLRKEPWPYLKPDSQVRISYGSLTGLEGTVIRTQGNTLLVISITLLQRSVAVHIDPSWVEPVQPASNAYGVHATY